MTTDNPHRITFQRNWGTRLPRSYEHFYTRTKPTIDEAVMILQRRVSPRASVDWFAEHNSGLVSITPIEWEPL